MYKIIGSDNLEYGPVSAEVIRQWIAEGRLNAQSRLRAETSPDWLAVVAFPEFAADLAPRIPPSPPRPPVPMPPYHTVSNPAATNKLAIAGFACSLASVILCCCGLLAIPGLIMSIIAFVQIRKNPFQGGRGLAVAGIIIAALALLANLLSLISFLTNPQGFDQILNNFK